MNRAERIFKKILKVFPTLKGMEEGDHVKLESGGFMPLSLDVLNINGNMVTIALAHNSVQNGDVMADPDMQIRLNFKIKTAQAMTFQNDYLSIYQESVFVNADGKTMCRPKLMKEHNAFLDQWTKNIIDQGFQG